MEEKEKKKPLILKILRITIYILLSIIFVCLIYMLCNYKTKTLKAEEIQLDYKNYNIVATIEDSYLDNGTYEGHITIIGTIQNNEVNYINIILDYPDFTCEETDLLSGPYETYGASSIEQDKLYYLQTEEDYPSQTYTIIGASEYNTYLQWQKGDTYSEAYGLGVNETDASSAYNEGKKEGQKETINEYTNNIIPQIKIQYDNAISSLNADIRRLQDTINNGNTNWGDFKSLLGTIFMFPIAFFKEGFNVNIFGINVGNFILGIGILIILITILTFILRGKVGNKE